MKINLRKTSSKIGWVLSEIGSLSAPYRNKSKWLSAQGALSEKIEKQHNG